MKNDLKRSKLTTSVVPLYVASWDGAEKTNKNGITDCKSEEFKAAVIEQLGKDEADYFNKSFVNYSSGFILCVNTPLLLSKFYKSEVTVSTGVDPQTGQPTGTAQAPGIAPKKYNSRKLVRFCKVVMPSEFKDQEKSLSSNYKSGEKLSVRASYEMVKFSSVNKMNKKKTIQKVVYRDSNVSGRSRLRTSSGGGAGVWS